MSATVLLGAGVAPVVWGVATGPLGRRVVAQNMGTTVVCLVLLLLAQGYERPSYADLALVLAVLGPVGTLVYARLLAEDLTGIPPAAGALTVAAAVATGAVTVLLCTAAAPGRTTAKLLVIGALLATGNVIASRALSGGFPGASRAGRRD
ncbi:monovalent cation/H+ antiporter complex subunit F [Streptomyces sp. NPDC050738]|uniref:monovalent cation/H+ antiporter complex subunit F n=1 Tax=Streptomyces sp. NPDC050738 TaxID=3154744 RepID=UPI00341CAC2E